MIRELATVFVIALASPVFAQEWIQVASNNDGDVWSIKAGSFELTRNRSGQEIAVVLGSTHVSSTNRITYRKWYVTGQDCIAGLGKMVTLDVTGEFRFDSDFVKSGQSIAAAIADTICGLYAIERRNRQGRGL